MAEQTATTAGATHEPRGTSSDDEAQQSIQAGLSAGSLGQTIALPAPRLVHDFRLRAKLEGKIGLGASCWGERNWIGICGGEWSATWGRGIIVVSVFLFLSLFFFFKNICLHVCTLIGFSVADLKRCDGEGEGVSGDGGNGSGGLIYFWRMFYLFGGAKPAHPLLRNSSPTSSPSSSGGFFFFFLENSLADKTHSS